MAREIKFRAWDGEKMFQANAVYLKGCYRGRFDSYGADSGVEIGPGDSGEKEVYEIGTNLMQYTGLQDKNGKEIYEGDTVMFSDGVVGVTKWSNSRAGFYFDVNEPDTKWNTELFCEVIGNIYENPELLTPTEAKY